MIPSVLSWDAVVEPMADSSGWIAIAVCAPEIIGHGDTDDEAIDDLREQLEAIEYH